MIYKRYLKILFLLLYLDIIFHIFAYDTFPILTFINILLFDVINSIIILMITNVFKAKTNKIITYVIFIFLWIWYSIYYVFYKVFITPFSITLFRQSDQVLKFGKSMVIAIIRNMPVILLFLVPVIVIVVFNKKVEPKKKVKNTKKVKGETENTSKKNKTDIKQEVTKSKKTSGKKPATKKEVEASTKSEPIKVVKTNKKIKDGRFKLREILICLILLVSSVDVYILNMRIQGKNTGGIYNLYYETNNISLNIEKLGVMASTYLDVKRMIFGFDQKIQSVKYVDNIEENIETPKYYKYNNLDIDFTGGSGNIKKINEFMENEPGTKQNEYTGIFRDKNLIFIVAESFSELAVSEELTPTIYKLVHEGFYFKNFYTSNNLSTIGGEFQALTGLYADNSILSNWRSGSSYYLYGLGNVFKNAGYDAYAYHNNSGYFQNRNVYLKSQGFDNFKACYIGLDKLINCKRWPQSDVEMIDATVSDYLDSDNKFIAYYMTVSGHFYYDYSGNSIAKKNRNFVDHLDYPEEVRGYLATQIELDRALESLLNKLEEAGKLDDTVIVMLADHYPYNLPLEYINMLSDYERDSLIEVNSNNLIIYNSAMDPVEVDKVGMSIDVLPTVLNLFGVDYDSRLIIGKDILSTNDGIAIFKDMSWVTNKGTYYASKRKFVGEEVDQEYIDTINTIVNNRQAISRMIVNNNYYKYILNQQNKEDIE